MRRFCTILLAHARTALLFYYLTFHSGAGALRKCLILNEKKISFKINGLAKSLISNDFPKSLILLDFFMI